MTDFQDKNLGLMAKDYQGGEGMEAALEGNRVSQARVLSAQRAVV